MNPPTELAPSSLTATAAFYERSSGVRLFRAALRTTQSLWPTLAARLAKTLFLTPLPPKWMQRSKPWGESWRIEPLRFEQSALTVYRYQRSPFCCPGDELEVSRPHVLITHGWGGSAQQMQPLAQALIEAGLSPVIVEMPGHGRSAGWHSSLPQFARALDFVASSLVLRGAKLQALIAHSLGGSAAAYALGRGLPAQRLVLIAAPDAPRDYTFMFAQVFGLSESTRAAMQRRIESSEGMWMSQFDASLSAPRVGQPALIVHDEQDSVNVVSSAHRLAQHMPQAQIYLSQGLGHRKILSERTVLERITAFVTAD
jgi:pimeloyl-ACP methyl ester carboxylesterase